MRTPEWAREALRAVEDADGLERVATVAADINRTVVGDAAVADALRGTWLGHPLHPMLTDLPIGFWTSATILDLVGGRRSARAARALVGLGVVSALPTALAGSVDWRDLKGAPSRVATVHAAANVAALTLYAWSWSARRRHRLVGIALGLAGATAATIGGYLGGELVFPSDPEPRSPVGASAGVYQA
jgi:uncharacterized membrane protein